MSVHPHDPAARFERIWAETRDPIVRYLARRAAPDSVEDLFAEVMTVAWRRLAAADVCFTYYRERLRWYSSYSSRVVSWRVCEVPATS